MAPVNSWVFQDIIPILHTWSHFAITVLLHFIFIATAVDVISSRTTLLCPSLWWLGIIRGYKAMSEVLLDRHGRWSLAQLHRWNSQNNCTFFFPPPPPPPNQWSVTLCMIVWPYIPPKHTYIVSPQMNHLFCFKPLPIVCWVYVIYFLVWNMQSKGPSLRRFILE